MAHLVPDAFDLTVRIVWRLRLDFTSKSDQRPGTHKPFASLNQLARSKRDPLREKWGRAMA
jgi:hypothetical protein